MDGQWDITQIGYSEQRVRMPGDGRFDPLLPVLLIRGFDEEGKGKRIDRKEGLEWLMGRSQKRQCSIFDSKTGAGGRKG